MHPVRGKPDLARTTANQEVIPLDQYREPRVVEVTGITLLVVR